MRNIVFQVGVTSTGLPFAQGGAADFIPFARAAVFQRCSMSVLNCLRTRNYRLFFFGQGTSVIGNWMQDTARGWLVYSMTHRPDMLGWVAFAATIMPMFVSPMAGVLADRFSRRRLLVVAESLLMAQAFVLAFLAYTGYVQVWHILFLSVTGGLIFGCEMPIRQSLVAMMVERREDLPHALALNSFLINGARLVGPVAAGAIIYLFESQSPGDYRGQGICFFLNALSFLAVIAALLKMRFPQEVNRATGHVLRNLAEGARYVRDFMPIRTAMVLLSIISLIGFPCYMLLPVFARDILHGNAKTFGTLQTAMAVGAVIGALAIARRKTLYGLDRMLGFGPIIFGAALICFSQSRNIYLSWGFLVLAGLGNMTLMVNNNTFVQTLVDESKRGRVMGLYGVAMLGMGPFGNLFSGWVAQKYGAPIMLVAGGSFCILTGIVYHTQVSGMRARFREAYVAAGVMRPVEGAVLPPRGPEPTAAEEESFLPPEQMEMVLAAGEEEPVEVGVRGHAEA
jgi:MFS family permease